MSEKYIEVRQSKKYTILTGIGALLIVAFLLMCFSLMLFKIISGLETRDEIVIVSISICTFLCFAISITVMFVFVMYTYKKQVDIYTSEKIIRKRKNKILFELPYNNIVTVREGFESVFMVLKTHITEANGKKGTRNFYAHYSRADISRIKSMITLSLIHI